MNFLAITCYVAIAEKKRKNRLKIFSGTAIGIINFKRHEKQVRSGGHKYFLAPLNNHIFSPYFRIPKRSYHFFHPATLHFMDSILDTYPSVHLERCVFHDNRIKCLRFMMRGIAYRYRYRVRFTRACANVHMHH